MSRSSTEGRVAKTLLISDLVESTRLVQRLGDLRASELFARIDRSVRDLLVIYEGLEIDKTDGFLMLFERPIQAVACAAALHAALREVSEQMAIRLEARIGIHFGEVILRRNSAEDVALGAKRLEVEGLAKPITARLMSLALPRQTLLTRSAFERARPSAADLDLCWREHGEYQLQGLPEPIAVYEVGAAGTAPLAPPPGNAKARPLAPDASVLGWRPAPGVRLPERPHWVLERSLGGGGPVERWLVRHEKMGERRLLWLCFERRHLEALERQVSLDRLLRGVLGHRRDLAHVLDWGFDESPFFVELEHTEQGDLAAWLQARGGAGRVPLAARLEVVAQAAEALAAVHSVGVLHEGLRPEVILIQESGGGPWVRLGGFDSEPAAEPYRAPELEVGALPSIQSDLYALGVVLEQLVADEVRSVGRHPGLEHLIGRLLEPSPRRRPASALELASALRVLPGLGSAAGEPRSAFDLLHAAVSQRYNPASIH